MAKINKIKSQIVLTPEEIKRAASLEFNPKGVDLSFIKFILPEALGEKMNVELNEVIQKYLGKLAPAQAEVDELNGAGFFDALCDMHAVKVSLFSAKTQGAVARQMAVATGKVPAAVFEKDAAPKATNVADGEMSIELDLED